MMALSRPSITLNASGRLFLLVLILADTVCSLPITARVLSSSLLHTNSVSKEYRTSTIVLAVIIVVFFVGFLVLIALYGSIIRSYLCRDKWRKFRRAGAQDPRSDWLKSETQIRRLLQKDNTAEKGSKFTRLPKKPPRVVLKHTPPLSPLQIPQTTFAAPVNVKRARTEKIED